MPTPWAVTLHSCDKMTARTLSAHLVSAEHLCAGTGLGLHPQSLDAGGGCFACPVLSAGSRSAWR